MEVPSRFEIDDALWAEIEQLIPPRVRRYRHPGRKALPDRLALNGILYVLHTGSPVRIPERSDRLTGAFAARNLSLCR